MGLLSRRCGRVLRILARCGGVPQARLAGPAGLEGVNNRSASAAPLHPIHSCPISHQTSRSRPSPSLGIPDALLTGSDGDRDACSHPAETPGATVDYFFTHMPLSAVQRWSLLQYSESLQSSSVTAVHCVPFHVQSPYFLQPSVALHVSAGAGAAVAATGFSTAALLAGLAAGVLEELSLEPPPQQPDTAKAATDDKIRKVLVMPQQ